MDPPSTPTHQWMEPPPHPAPGDRDTDPATLPVYLDYNASTPLSAAVAHCMSPFLWHHFGNPSSTHLFGVRAKQAVEDARQQVATALQAHPDEILFTSGGTESNNMAILGAALNARKSLGVGVAGHVITSTVEHPAVMEVCRLLEREHGFHITYVPVSEGGRVDPAAVRDTLRPNTVLITIMHANNETGVIQPIREIAAIASERGVLMHTDAAQSIGKIPCSVSDLGVDLLSVCAHKFYGPKGVGALFVRRGVTLLKLMHGANHERNLRAGTENVLEIVGLGSAIELASRNLEKNMEHMQRIRDRLQESLLDGLPAELVRVHGDQQYRLPNTLSIGFSDVDGNGLLDALSDSLAASCGAACHSGEESVSYVLRAMNVPPQFLRGTIRLSVGVPTTDEEINRVVPELLRVVRLLAPSSSASPDHEVYLGGDVDPSTIRLTTTTKGLGCGCKLRPQLLEQILRDLPDLTDASVLVGSSSSDDAGVYRLTPELALVQTLDFFTPIVDDAFSFGSIAAANALSDVYAMGGTPLTALNIVAFPSTRLPLSILRAILAGAHAKAQEAGVSVLGGHSIDDTELKYGMSVTGIVHPNAVWANKGAQPGDVLVLTKPIGTGMLSTAMKRRMLTKLQAQQAIQVMSTLNRRATEQACQLGLHVHACTDVTGFGLLGHLKEVMQASGTSCDLFLSQIPLLDGAEAIALGGVAVPGGSRDNLEFVSNAVDYHADVPSHLRLLLADAQTSGGLLFSLRPQDADTLVDAMQSSSQQGDCDGAWVVGTVTQHVDVEAPFIRVQP